MSTRRGISWTSPISAYYAQAAAGTLPPITFVDPPFRDGRYPAALDALKDELIAVISRHVEIDPSTVQIDIAHEGRQQRLIADIPLRVTGRRRTN